MIAHQHSSILFLFAAVGAVATADVHQLRSHSTSAWFDKPTALPTTLDYFKSPYFYGNYGNNVADPYSHFYEWPYRKKTTYVPTAQPTAPHDGFPILSYAPTSSPQPTNHQGSSDPNLTSRPLDTWKVLTQEHFLEGYGVFQEVDSEDTQHYSSALGRQGVVQLKKSSSLPSHAIAVDSKKLKVVFSFYANSMAAGEGFCLESSINDDTDWYPERCWQSSIDFENNKWHDDFSVELNLDDSEIIQVDSLRIKFALIVSRDDPDVMFDRISLLQS
jgi:hypothetical protein